MKLLTVLLLTLALCVSGCATGPYIQHPGAHSIFESKIYDVFNDANNTLNIARPQLASGALPARFKDIVAALLPLQPRRALDAHDLSHGHPSYVDFEAVIVGRSSDRGKL